MSASDAVRPRPPAALRITLALLVTAVEAAILAGAMGGFDRLLAHPRALTLVACWAISGAALAWMAPRRGRAAVARSPEGRWGLVLLGLIPLIVAPLSAYAERAGVWPLPGGAPLRWVGVGLAALGLTLRVAAMGRLGARFSPTLTVQPEHRLETKGLYARLRHPGYLGSLCASLGAAIAFGSGLGLVPVALFLLVLRARVRREETMLASHFGEEWSAYRSRSGAFWPRLGGTR